MPAPMQPTEWQSVCPFDDLPDPGARGFTLRSDPPVPAFVVRRDDGVHAYINICPHAGNQLNWKPDAFLTADRTRIMCSAHGAVFDVSSGRCVAGPGLGHELRALEVRVHRGWIEARARPVPQAS